MRLIEELRNVERRSSGGKCWTGDGLQLVMGGRLVATFEKAPNPSNGSDTDSALQRVANVRLTCLMKRALPDLIRAAELLNELQRLIADDANSPSPGLSCEDLHRAPFLAEIRALIARLNFVPEVQLPAEAL